ncbi:hypothetical protein [Bacillus sp. B15-48]|uniref:hypothetical protein n=1 Tax=Bacillus sp. B15-48 TaxID=1548601 RepID=UPI00193F20E9|nr:hypothetical protein [Bacillus sp. B15-48]MBM4763598.1 hypothetical protein [Bacillus sp. B15-48]
MEQLKNIVKSFIILFSQGLWIYHVIFLFTSLKVEEFAAFDATWWAIAAAVGYILNLLLTKKIVAGVIINIVVIGWLLYQNWVLTVPEGIWGFGIAHSLALLFIWVRAASFCYQKPLRRSMLNAFEGNILFYLIFAAIFIAKDWDNERFHLLFIFSIGLSLIGMILSLQSHGEKESGQSIEIRKVGESKSLSAMLLLLFVSIPLLSLLLLFPAVNRAVTIAVIAVWEGIKWIGGMLMELLMWVMSLFPESKPESLEGMQPQPSLEMGEIVEEPIVTMPISWLITSVLVLIAIIAITVLVKVLKNRKPREGMVPKQIIVSKESWWKNIKQKLLTLLYNWRIGMRRRFPHFYYQSVYWYYYQLQKWGKKNGFPIVKTETSKEYIQRIIAQLPDDKSEFEYDGNKYYVQTLLNELNRDYQAAYYGGVDTGSKEKYRILLKNL